MFFSGVLNERLIFSELFCEGPSALCKYALTVVRGLTDGVLADAFLIFSQPKDTAHQLKEGKGSSKKVRKQVTEKKHLLVNEKRKCRDG